MNDIHPIKLWFSFAFRMVFFAVALLWPAGTWYWWEAWVVIALWAVWGFIMTVYLLKNDPALLKERLKFVPIHQEQKKLGQDHHADIFYHRDRTLPGTGF